jgi:hypothetical protein
MNTVTDCDGTPIVFGTPVTVWAVAEAGDARTLVVTDDGVALRVGPYDWDPV